MVDTASISMGLFRKSSCSRPLHSRWGDVAISVPTDGSWNQYDNPHQAGRLRRQDYGPGFVPDMPISSASFAIRDSVIESRRGTDHDIDDDGGGDGSHKDGGDEALPRHPRRQSAALSVRRSPLNTGHRRTPSRSSTLPRYSCVNTVDAEDDCEGSMRSGSGNNSAASDESPLRPYPNDRAGTNEKEPNGRKAAIPYVYKPIRQDYLAEMEAQSQAQLQLRQQKRFRYIPVTGGSLENVKARSLSLGQMDSALFETGLENPYNELQISRRCQRKDSAHSSARPGEGNKKTAPIETQFRATAAPSPSSSSSTTAERSRGRSSSQSTTHESCSASMSGLDIAPPGLDTSASSRSARRSSFSLLPSAARRLRTAASDKKAAAVGKRPCSTGRAMTVAMVPDLDEIYG